jgi:hypothetical protein
VRRRLIPKQSFHVTRRHLAPIGSPVGRKLAATIEHLLDGWTPDERRRVVIAPSLACWACRVPGTALALWYNEGEDYVTLHAVRRWGVW